MKSLFTLIFSALLLSAFSASNPWSKVANKNLSVAGVQKIIPQKSSLVNLDDAAFKLLQVQIPKEESGQFIVLSLPLPDGTSKDFKVFERVCMDPELGARYPSIKTYEAIAVDDPFVTGKLDYTEFGFHAMIFSKEGVFFIDPYTNVNTGYYNSYYKKDYVRTSGVYNVCQVPEHNQNNNSQSSSFTNTNNTSAGNTVAIVPDGKIRTFRLALACTIEYSAAVGGPTPTKATVLSAMVTSLNRVNGVYEKDLSIHMNLVPKNDTLIFITTDSYSNDDGGAMLSQNKTVINARIGSANYDIGHVFSTGGGGIAGLGVVCTTDKAEGVTGSDDPVGDAFDIDYVAHEMGHQFGANHTFNAVTGSCAGNRESTAAYEPGSATTIMGYAGICGTNDIQLHSDDYFHRKSIDEIYTYISSTSCAVSTNSNNTTPTLSSYTATYYVPYKTSFEINASAADADGDPIKYCWEEYDLGPSGSWNATSNTAPLFRSFNPTYSGARVFPVWDSLIKNVIKYRGEVLPETTRDVKLRCTVRDLHNGYGAFNAPNADLTIKSVTTTTLFRVTNFATASTITGNTTQTINWDVAGTTDAPISCANVNIYLSLDSARTFPYLLAGNTANDGSETVTIPDVFTTTSSARIKVKSSNSVFFDLNNGWIKINQGIPATVASYTATDTTICAGSSITFSSTSTGSPDSVRWTINGGTPSTSGSGSVAATFPAAGNFVVSLTAYKGGNASAAFAKTIKVNSTKTTSFSSTICQGDSIVVGSQAFKTTGTFTVHLQTSLSCDSAVTLNLTVKPTKVTNLNQSICQGDSIMIGVQSFKATGTYTVHLLTSQTCDSTVNLNLVVNLPKTTSFSQTICEGDSVIVGSQSFKTGGLHTVHLLTSKNCDSTVNLTLAVDPKKTTNLSQTICDGENVTISGNIFTTNGIHTVVLQTSKGCDSVVNLNLTVNPKKTTNLNQSICEGQSVTISGNTFNTNGIHTVVLQTSLSCDSVVNLNLTVNPLPATPALTLRNDSLVATGSTGILYNWYLNSTFQTSTNIPAYKPTQQGSWTVKVISADDCQSVASAPLVITGVKNNKLNLSLSILPNPNNGQFELKITSDKSEKYNLVLYNLTGQEILKEEISVQQGFNVKRFALDELAKGMYYISLAGTEGVITKNIVIQ